MSEETSNNIPKVIWFLWLQGFDNAPMVVKKCYASWKRYNPDWDIVFLDEGNLGKYLALQELGIKSENVTKQAFSNLVRINLLAKYGGVWADATCLCRVSLDTWLNEYTTSGFFAFHKPGRDRLISSWFLASTKNGYLVSKWRDESNAYWRNNNFSSKRNRFVVAILIRIFNRNTYMTKFWFSFFIRKIIKVHPYFWFHYLFRRIIERDTRFKQVWTRTKKYSADIPLRVDSSLFQPLSEEIKQYIDSKQSPVYKLTWKYNVSDYKDGCTMHYLIKSIPTTEHNNPDSAYAKFTSTRP